MRAAPRTTSLAVLMLVGACGVKTTYVPTNPPPRPMQSRSPESVAIYTTALPDRPYTEVGLFEAQGRNQNIEMEDLIAELRGEAAEVGCDAIVMTGTRNQVVGSSPSNSEPGGSSVHTNKGYAATCIVYQPEQPAPAGGGPAPGAAGALGTTPAAAPAPDGPPSPAPASTP